MCRFAMGRSWQERTVVIQNADTGISRTAQTNSAGRYSAPSLSLGNFRVTASLAGFQTEVRTGIVLTVSREAVVDFRLPVGAVSQTVEVTGEAPPGFQFAIPASDPKFFPDALAPIAFKLNF